MAEFDFLSIIVPSLIAAIISFVIIGINKLGKTSEVSLTGSVRLDHITSAIKQLEERIDRHAEKMEISVRTIWQQLEDIRSDQKLSTYRLDRIEEDSGRGKGDV